MNFGAAEKIANAVLYEGYMLYPYRPSAMKNQQRWNFGTLYPAQFDGVRRGTERSFLHAECLLQANSRAKLGVLVRFLQPGPAHHTTGWGESLERKVEITATVGDSGESKTFSFSAGLTAVHGVVRATFEVLQERVLKLSVDLTNETEVAPEAAREQALAHSLVSAHVMLRAEGGEFVSLLDPPEALREAVMRCKSSGCFPVLVGDERRHNTMLCSPIILYDYPQIAPESVGDFFDATEMDEMLTLRVTNLTDEEKDEVRSSDDRGRLLLDRTEQTVRKQLMRTHGVIRSMRRVNGHE
jgi:hypothetical protein